MKPDMLAARVSDLANLLDMGQGIMRVTLPPQCGGTPRRVICSGTITCDGTQYWLSCSETISDTELEKAPTDGLSARVAFGILRQMAHIMLKMTDQYPVAFAPRPWST